MTMTKRDNVDLAYDIQGTGPDLLLIAGTASDRSMWAQTRDALSKKFRTIAFDNRDAGQSTICKNNEVYSLKDLAKDALAVLDAAGSKKAHILGHSLGGMIAQELTLLAPERVSTLTLVNTTSRFDTYTNNIVTLASQWTQQIEDQKTLLKSLFFVALGSTTLQSISLDNLIDSMMGSGTPQPREALIRQWQVDSTINTTQRLPNIKVPTHVIWGAQDKFFLENLQQEFIEKIANAKLSRIEASGHCPPIEVPDDFVKLAVEFLQKH